MQIFAGHRVINIDGRRLLFPVVKIDHRTIVLVAERRAGNKHENIDDLVLVVVEPERLLLGRKLRDVQIVEFHDPVPDGIESVPDGKGSEPHRGLVAHFGRNGNDSLECQRIVG